MTRAGYVPRVWVRAAREAGEAERRAGRSWIGVEVYRRQQRRFADELAAAWLDGWKAADRREREGAG